MWVGGRGAGSGAREVPRVGAGRYRAVPEPTASGRDVGRSGGAGAGQSGGRRKGTWATEGGSAGGGAKSEATACRQPGGGSVRGSSGCRVVENASLPPGVGWKGTCLGERLGVTTGLSCTQVKKQ